MRRLLFITILCCSAVAFADSTTDNKKVLIDKLLTQMGQSATDTGKLFSNLFIDQMSVALKKAKPDVDPRAYEIIKEEVSAIVDEVFSDSNTFAEMMYPIYETRFTEEELNELIDFYNTALGKKLISELPAITKEGMDAGTKLGESLAPKIQQRIKARLDTEGIEM